MDDGETPSLVLGIDGGGTKSAAWLSPLHAGPNDDPLGRGTAGPGNPRSSTFQIAFANIDLAIANAFANAGLPRQRVRAVCVALAGIDRDADRGQMLKWCTDRNFAQHLLVTNDANPILAAAGEDNWGVALIAGTGSFAIGRNRAGETARCGGWGYLMGDEGSGYAIALAALRAAARSADGRAAPTRLLPLLQDKLQAAIPQELVGAVYRPEMQRGQIAELADVVFVAAQDGDVTAQEIVTAAALDLAELVRTLADKLQLPTANFPLAMAGGILLNQVSLRAALEQQLVDTNAAPGSITLVPEPVRGAVVLARKSAAGR